MKKRIHLLLMFMLLVFSVRANVFKGVVLDKQTGEAVVGAKVQLIHPIQKITFTGLNGSFEFKELKAGKYKIKISYIAYKTSEQDILISATAVTSQRFIMEVNANGLNEVVINGRSGVSDDHTARSMERHAVPIANIVSGKSIEISPDLTVANVMQRVSGVSIERNSNGDGQYAILRGMDKRYNYTLVNGIKIPSPDNKYRYVPLDLFPSDLLDRLEVYKSLTPNMEGDAVGGVVNMVMKNAPERLTVNANLATGYNQLFLDRKFGSFDASGINKKSPSELFGKSYNASQADFGKGTLDYSSKQPAPNLVGSFSVGQRFLNSKLGIIAALSYQNTYRGSNSTFYRSANAGTDRFAVITNKDERQYSEQQKRLGAQAKVDYLFNPNNKISLYSVYVDLKNQQVRDVVSTTYNGVYNPTAGNAELVYTTRSRLTQQQIYNNTLQGDHYLLDQKLHIQWSGVFSSARNAQPDNTQISLNGIRSNFQESRLSLVNTAPVTRRWERNTDQDLAGYLDLTYSLKLKDAKLDLMAGGLYRDKQRSSFFNNYTLAPSAADASLIYGVDYNNYTELNLIVTNPTGAVSNPLTYDATEKTAAGYGMFKLGLAKLELMGGVRIEHNDQGYNLLFPAGEQYPKGSQVYTDVLPSLVAKYHLNKRNQLHASYFKSVNRPGFYEIVPSKVVNEEFQERGNPFLQRAIADNFDLRYELFPGAAEQLLIGAFYKRIVNPIEYTFQADATRGQDIYYSPGNFGTAKNYGAEVDYIKYFKNVGLKANYTYTHSSITTPKTARRINPSTGDIEAYSVNQTRPLYGQSEHVANLSLLYKDSKKGWDFQLAGAYTGPRINTISQFVDNDLWQEGFVQMDFSAEKTLKGGFAVFVKAANLLNTPNRLFIKGVNPENDSLMEDIVSDGRTKMRNDLYGQSYLIGVRFKFTK